MEDSVTLVDYNDNPLGPVTKFQAHLRENLALVDGKAPDNLKQMHGKIGPHRAFSLLLFNSKNELLMQQRSKHKVTFPLMWTNSCCSHPRHTPEELVPDSGIRLAAVRRSSFELGIKEGTLDPDELRIGTKILYYAPGCDTFAEWELDYIIFAKKDLELAPNEAEISAIEYIKRTELRDFLAEKEQKGEAVTPWFKLLVE